jgi:hypothetical protein
MVDKIITYCKNLKLLNERCPIFIARFLHYKGYDSSQREGILAIEIEPDLRLWK